MDRTLRSTKTTKQEIAVPSFGFTGEMASGKSTYANRLSARLEEEFGISVLRPSFSAKIMEVAADLFRMDGKDRVLLGEISSKMREIDPMVWVNVVVRQIEENGSPPFVVDGIRLVQDEIRLRERFPSFIIVRIFTDEQQRSEAYKRAYGRYPTEEDLNNKGEGDISKLHYDLRLVNNYTDENREMQLNGIIDSIRAGTIAELLRH